MKKIYSLKNVKRIALTAYFGWTITNAYLAGKTSSEFYERSGIGTVLNQRHPKLYELDKILEAEKAIKEAEKIVQRKPKVLKEIESLNEKLRDLGEKASNNPELQELIEKEKIYGNRGSFPLTLFREYSGSLYHWAKQNK